MRVRCDRSKTKHPLVACYPLHDRQDKRRLMHSWLRCRSVLRPPIDHVRDYFGTGSRTHAVSSHVCVCVFARGVLSR